MDIAVSELRGNARDNLYVGARIQLRHKWFEERTVSSHRDDEKETYRLVIHDNSVPLIVTRASSNCK